MVKPNVWGPCTWRFIHTTALGYSGDDPDTYYAFYKDLYKILPCQKCSRNYERHWNEIDIRKYLRSNVELFKWTVLLHNIVNKELGKKEMRFEEALRLYTGAAASSAAYKYIVAMVLLLITIFFVSKHKWS